MKKSADARSCPASTFYSSLFGVLRFVFQITLNMNMLKMRTWIKRIVVNTPLLDRLYFRRSLGDLSNEKILRARIQFAAHVIELRLTTGDPVERGIVRELDYLLKKAFRRGLGPDDTLVWALEQFVAGRYGLPFRSRPDPGICRGNPSQEGGSALYRIITERRSVRSWTTEPVDFEMIKPLIDLAKWAPSSCNRQLWQVMPVRRENRELIASCFPNDFYRGAPLLLLILVNGQGYADHEKHFAYLDAGAFIQNLLLCLHDAGYGACWIGFKGWNLDHPFRDPDRAEAFYNALGLDRNTVPVSMIAVGRPAQNPRPPARQPLESILLGR